MPPRRAYQEPAPVLPDALLAEACVPLVIALALFGMVAFVMAPIAWRYAVTELRKIDAGDLQAAHRRQIDHARVLAMVATIVYAILLPFALASRA